ncbi:hypothetical protein MSHOH_1482 [Methanosarcina horonobensis HB-1 = JCM 15518]|uniref:Uncharacterized protein n=2 Tax=Methanosarcina horonobensis TaxID=418008 RepID=A0A0E3WUG0_9EURY|nr:hypothetical protein MSHOH_1482 [Methanosarcina horonobensis HB-1 = JCM 15518]
MAEIKYKKEKVTATVSPHVRKRIDEYVASEEFSSVSDFVNTALAYFLGKLDYQKELEAAAKEPTQVTDERDQLLIDVIKKLVENPELLSSIKEQTKSGASKKHESLPYPAKRESFSQQDYQKEREECRRNFCPNPRELTPEEARKAAEAKAYYRALRGEKEEPEEVGSDQKTEPDGKKPRVLFEGEPKDYPQEWILE